MQQERLKQTLDWVRRVEATTEKILKSNTKETKSQMHAAAWAKGMLRTSKTLDYALCKTVEKKARMDGSRAHCPDCGTNIRSSDNYCRKCGQRLAREKPKKPYYERYQKKHGGSKSK